MKLLTVVGARPQFIKAAAMSRCLKHRGVDEVLVHTGQHYDENMSEVFFEELEIPPPAVNLAVGSGPNGQQTGRMLEGIEKILFVEKPDVVLVYGDTNSTLAGALAAAKLQIPIAHVEAGLRSFNKTMPEEINRILTDHLARWCFCPSQTAVDNLKAEGITEGVHLVGDVMADALSFAQEKAALSSSILKTLSLSPGDYVLATVHRAENTDNPKRLKSIVDAFSRIKLPVVFPVHPRTRPLLEMVDLPENIRVIAPLGYLDMVQLLSNAKVLLTDSGGMQKEAYWVKTPCVTLRDETEWVETVQTGWNILTGVATERIIELANNFPIPREHPPLYAEGSPCDNCIDWLLQSTEA